MFCQFWGCCLLVYKSLLGHICDHRKLKKNLFSPFTLEMSILPYSKACYKHVPLKALKVYLNFCVVVGVNCYESGDITLTSEANLRV